MPQQVKLIMGSVLLLDALIFYFIGTATANGTLKKHIPTYLPEEYRRKSAAANRVAGRALAQCAPYMAAIGVVILALPLTTTQVAVLFGGGILAIVAYVIYASVSAMSAKPSDKDDHDLPVR